MVQFLADGLEGGPTTTSRSWCGQAHTAEPGWVGEVRHLQRRHVVVPKVAGEGHQWGQARFGQVPVPLGPGAVGAVGKIEGVHGGAVLPPVVTGRVKPPGRVSSGGHVPPPSTLDDGGLDVEFQEGPKRRPATPAR